MKFCDVIEAALSQQSLAEYEEHRTLACCWFFYYRLIGPLQVLMVVWWLKCCVWLRASISSTIAIVLGPMLEQWSWLPQNKYWQLSFR